MLDWSIISRSCFLIFDVNFTLVTCKRFLLLKSHGKIANLDTSFLFHISTHVLKFWMPLYLPICIMISNHYNQIFLGKTLFFQEKLDHLIDNTSEIKHMYRSWLGILVPAVIFYSCCCSMYIVSAALSLWPMKTFFCLELSLLQIRF